MKLTADIVYGFSGTLLASKFDNPQPTPDFHKELWELALGGDKYVAIAAPRGHAKSTAVTHVLTLAYICFKQKRHIMLVSDTEDQAKLFLADIKAELLENEDLRKSFDIGITLKETETEIICTYKDSDDWFRIFVRGSSQKLRGSKYRGTRPDLIICDDIENDEAVSSKDRRDKFSRWFFGALTPTLSDRGQIVVVGTILHFDSLLERLLRNKKWKSKRYAAHNSDFSEILWEEKWPKQRLIDEREMLIAEGKLDVYSQEYLNWPMDESYSYFRKEWFKELTEKDTHLRYYVGVDLAISKRSRADFSVFTVVGVDHRGILQVRDVIRDRMDALDIINTFFNLQQRYNPELFVVEHGQISQVLGPILTQEQLKRGIFLNLPDTPFTPTRDKESRAKPLQARMRAGGVEFDKDAPWYATQEDEFLKFPRGVHDDQVDSLSWICLALDKVIEGMTAEERLEDEYDDIDEEFDADLGRSFFCGY